MRFCNVVLCNDVQRSTLGIRHVTTRDLPVDPIMKAVLNTELKDVNNSLDVPICITEVELNAQAFTVRTGEVVTVFFASVIDY